MAVLILSVDCCARTGALLGMCPKRKPAINNLAFLLPLVFQTLTVAVAGAPFTLPEATLAQARSQYDDDGYQRVVALRDFISRHHGQ